MSLDEIRKLIREKIARGLLPSTPAREVWGGRGTGAICAACGHPITPVQSEIEADCVDNVPRFYHAECHQIVESERGHTRHA